MFLSLNPSEEKIKEYIKASPHKAAKWIKDNETGDYYYWPASDTPHAKMAKMLRVTNYDKGLAVFVGSMPTGIEFLPCNHFGDGMSLIIPPRPNPIVGRCCVSGNC